MPFEGVPPKLRSALVADLFCGAGGSSQGAKRALERLGFKMDLLAINHWNVAIASHTLNFPDARHIIEDVTLAKPEQLIPEGKLDLLMASPTCTFHSRARGGKPINDQGRMDPWAIVRWVTELRVKRILVENVPEFVRWGPLDVRTKRPIKRREGEYFLAWVGALGAAGFKVDWKILNAADYGDATTRERFFLLGRSDGKRIVWPDASHSRHGSAGADDLLGFGTKKWRAAREIIDWSRQGHSIFARKRPLSPKTLARIYAGAVKFKWPVPFLVILRNHMDAQSIDEPLPTLCAGGTHVALAQPMMVLAESQGGNGLNCRPIEDPIYTVTTRGNIGLVEPFVFPLNQKKDRLRGHRSVNDPLCTVTASGTDLGMVEPFILNQDSRGKNRSLDEPIPTVCQDGAHALIAPYYGSGSGKTSKSVERPLDSVTTKDRFGLVMPVTHADGGNRARSLEDPLPTVTGAHRGELACIVAQWGERQGQEPRVHSVDEPTPTLCAGGRVQLAQGLVEPVFDGLHYDIRFRMLEPLELARAMGFSDADIDYEFTGTKTDVVRQIGNAVPVNLACALVGALFR